MGKFKDIPLSPGDFGESASTHTILTGPQLKTLFNTRDEKRAFLDLMDIIEERTSQNEMQADLIRNIDKYAGVVIKLVRKAALGF